MGNKSSKKKHNKTITSISQDNITYTERYNDSLSILSPSDTKSNNNSLNSNIMRRKERRKMTDLLLAQSPFFEPHTKHKEKIKRARLSRVLYNHKTSIVLESLRITNLITEQINKENNLNIFVTNNKLNKHIGQLDYSINNSSYYFSKKNKRAESAYKTYIEKENEECDSDTYKNYLMNDMISTRKENDFNLEVNDSLFHEAQQNLLRSPEEENNQTKQFPIVKVRSYTNNKSVHQRYKEIKVKNINININQIKVYNNNTIRQNTLITRKSNKHRTLTRSETPVFKQKKSSKEYDNICTCNVDNIDNFSFGHY